MKKISELKVGDSVTCYEPYSNNIKNAYEAKVTKVGRKYITVWHSTHFDKDTGHGENGYQLFVGNFDEFEAWFALKPTRMKQRSNIESMIRELDVPELTKIINFIQRLENETE